MRMPLHRMTTFSPVRLAACFSILFFTSIGPLAAQTANKSSGKPAAGTPTDYRSQNFLLHTDLSAEDAKELLTRLETMLGLINKYWAKPSSGLIECYVAKDLRQLRRSRIGQPLPACPRCLERAGGEQGKRIGEAEDPAQIGAVGWFLARSNDRHDNSNPCDRSYDRGPTLTVVRSPEPASHGGPSWRPIVSCDGTAVWTACTSPGTECLPDDDACLKRFG